VRRIKHAVKPAGKRGQVQQVQVAMGINQHKKPLLDERRIIVVFGFNAYPDDTSLKGSRRCKPIIGNGTHAKTRNNH
jgi:hypothetical protein